MSEQQTTPIPHFLRVVRALAKVSGVAIPVTALFTTVVPGCFSGCVMGDPPYMGSGGNGGGPVGLPPAPDAGEGGSGGSGGNDGGPVGLPPAPDAGEGGSGGSGSNDGGPVGLPPAPDAGDGG